MYPTTTYPRDPRGSVAFRPAPARRFPVAVRRDPSAPARFEARVSAARARIRADRDRASRLGLDALAAEARAEDGR